jgi:RNA polymerase sigma-70 factor (ECF subfamily)
MSHSTSISTEFLLQSAREGSRESLGRLLELYSNYLKLLVLGQLDRTVRARVSPSDVVQETFFEAHRDFGQFRGQSTGEFVAWLRRILVHNLSRVVEHHVLAEKRDVRREASLQRLASALEQSTARLEAVLPDSGSTPSMVAQRREMELVVADVLAEMPADYRDVIVLRNLEGLAFEDIGQRMERTSGAVRMLWLRAIKNLREQFRRRGIQ